MARPTAASSMIPGSNRSWPGLRLWVCRSIAIRAFRRTKCGEAHYGGLPGNFSFTLALSAGTWETRDPRTSAGSEWALDRHPRLQILIGHMGEPSGAL